MHIIGIHFHTMRQNAFSFSNASTSLYHFLGLRLPTPSAPRKIGLAHRDRDGEEGVDQQDATDGLDRWGEGKSGRQKSAEGGRRKAARNSDMESRVQTLSPVYLWGSKPLGRSLRTRHISPSNAVNASAVWKSADAQATAWRYPEARFLFHKPSPTSGCDAAAAAWPLARSPVRL